MLEVLDLPKYLNEHQNKVEDIKVVCVLNRQVEMPEHLKKLDKGSSNIPSLVDLVGVDIGGKKYVVKGQAVVMLGPRAYDIPSYGKKVLLLRGTAYLRDNNTNYLEILMVFPKQDNSLSLYATKMLFREIPEMRKVYPEIMKCVDELSKLNWDFEVFYNCYNTPANYRRCCSGCNFNVVSNSNKFVFKSEEDYRKGQVQGVIRSDLLSNTTDNYNDTNLSNNSKLAKLECRDNILPLPKEFKELEEKIENSKEKIGKEIDELVKYYGLKDADEDIDYLYNSLKKYWRRAPSPESVTGRALLKNVLEYLYPDLKNKYDNGISFIDSAIDNYKVLDIWYTEEIPQNLTNSVFYIEISQLRESLNIAVIDYLLGLKGHLISAYKSGQDLSLDLYSVLTTNPYYFSIVDSCLTIEDLDKLGMLFKVNLRDIEVLKFRNAAYLHNFMLDNTNPIIEDNTIIEKDEIVKNIYNGLIISSKAYKMLNTTGFIFSDKILYNLKYYIKENLESKNFMLSKVGWKERKIRGVSKYILPIFKESSSEGVMNDYLEVGLGIEKKINDKIYIMDYIYAMKERYIINRLYELQINGEKYNVDSSKIDQCIRGFERLKALEWNIPTFKLEQRQSDAVRLLYNPIMCLTGSAGSGKTTTAEAMLYALQALYGIEEDEIMFCAPTGKAANRLKEIVKKPTRTIHSLFGIGETNYTLLNEENVKKKAEIKVLIVDESSMINLNLMYNMITKISDGTRIIFLGDRSQLPPIGPGKPFANLLTFLPCVVLNVLKRAAENSGINYNANILLNNSEGSDIIDLKQFSDFRLIDAPKNKIVDLVMGIVNYHLGNAGPKRTQGLASQRVLQSLDVNLNSDDIQVVTPVNKYEWGTKNLNKVLQNVFNPIINSKIPVFRFVNDYEYVENHLGQVEKKYRYLELRLNDRVIHLENKNSADRYLMIKQNTFQKINTSSGVMNGDTGKIVGFIKGSQLEFIDDTGNLDDNTRKDFSDSDDVIYIAVKYLDVDENGKPLEFIIFYKSELNIDPENVELQKLKNIYTIEGSDLKYLDLAYALTVHKLQGSQAKLIIFVLYPVGYNTFISRNLIYTGITRAEKGIYVVGNVVGFNNVINKGRKIEQNSLRTTISDKIFVLDS